MLSFAAELLTHWKFTAFFYYLCPVFLKLSALFDAQKNGAWVVSCEAARPLSAASFLSRLDISFSWQLLGVETDESPGRSDWLNSMFLESLCTVLVRREICWVSISVLCEFMIASILASTFCWSVSSVIKGCTSIFRWLVGGAFTAVLMG